MKLFIDNKKSKIYKKDNIYYYRKNKQQIDVSYLFKKNGELKKKYIKLNTLNINGGGTPSKYTRPPMYIGPPIPTSNLPTKTLEKVPEQQTEITPYQTMINNEIYILELLIKLSYDLFNWIPRWHNISTHEMIDSIISIKVLLNRQLTFILLNFKLEERLKKLFENDKQILQNLLETLNKDLESMQNPQQYTMTGNKAQAQYMSNYVNSYMRDYDQQIIKRIKQRIINYERLQNLLKRTEEKTLTIIAIELVNSIIKDEIPQTTYVRIIQRRFTT